MTTNETEILFDVKEDTDFVTKYDLKIYDYENKKYINEELQKFEVQIMSIMTSKLENISMEISGIKTLLIEALLGFIVSALIIFIGALFTGVI